jgi:formyltetrahydrofolate-dependent phosphoribosylglycinamide formyltransferase
VSYRIAIAVSGRGSNLSALLRSLEGDTRAQVVSVLSHNANSGGAAIARAMMIPTAILEDPSDPRPWLAVLGASRADLLVLAGYVKLVPAEVVAAWRGRIINVHPALLPKFGGPGMYGSRVHQAVLAAGETESGATVHLVTEQYDEGAILAQVRVPVLPADTVESLADRVLAVEHQLLPAAVLHAAAAGAPVPFPFELEIAS